LHECKINRKFEKVIKEAAIDCSLNKNGNIIQTLEECLQNFALGETVNYKCDSCKTDGTATKQLTIFDTPPRLKIQLKR
jgi:uncharacterized UBP type Zn finger protein